MRILVLDERGAAIDFALRCIDDGHDVRVFIRQTPKTDKIGRGLVTLVPEWQPSMKWADLVFLSDNTRYLKDLDKWRAEGKCIVGPSAAAAEWELNRTLGMDLFRKHKIEVAPYKEFTNYDAAIAYVRKEGRAFVSKPCGDEPDKSLSYVAKSPADLIFMLERWKKAQRHKGAFILQEKIDGIEMAVGGWFGPGGFNQGWLENWECKKLFPGDLGPSTGEMGTVTRVVRKSKLADLVLKPFEDDLEALGYVGFVDVNCIITEDGTPYPLEFTMRPGWPTFNIQQALIEGDHAEWLLDLCEGRDAKNWVMDKVAVGVVVALPDFPYSHVTRKEVTGIPLYIRGSTRNVHPCEIMAGEAPHDVDDAVVQAPCWVTAGDYVYVASGLGDTVSAARRAAYRVIDRVAMPASPFWRRDIGLRLGKELDKLQALGFAAGMEF